MLLLVSTEPLFDNHVVSSSPVLVLLAFISFLEERISVSDEDNVLVTSYTTS